MYTEKRLKRKSLRHTLMLALLGALLLLSPAAHAQMSAEAVGKYVLEARRSGKSDRQIGQELLARGVTPAQVERLKQKYEESRERSHDSSETLTAGSLDAVDAQVSDPTEGAANPREVFGRNVFRSRTRARPRRRITGWDPATRSSSTSGARTSGASGRRSPRKGTS